jgi:hypothetical protein
VDVEGARNDAGRSGTIGTLDDDVGRLLEGEAVVGSDGVAVVAGNEELVCSDELTTSAPPFLSQGFGGETIVC